MVAPLGVMREGKPEFSNHSNQNMFFMKNPTDGQNYPYFSLQLCHADVAGKEQLDTNSLFILFKLQLFFYETISAKLTNETKRTKWVNPWFR